MNAIHMCIMVRHFHTSSMFEEPTLQDFVASIAACVHTRHSRNIARKYCELIWIRTQVQTTLILEIVHICTRARMHAFTHSNMYKFSRISSKDGLYTLLTYIVDTYTQI
jgi:hypothetical protein